MIIEHMMTEAESDQGVVSDDQRIILEDLSGIFTRTLIFETKYQKQKLRGNTEEEKYLSFLQMLQTEPYQKELQEAYPVLDEVLSMRCKMIQDFLDEVRVHFETDYEELVSNNLIGKSGIGIQSLQCTAGDTHNKARHVILLTLSDGSKLIYKPHRLAVDNAFSDVVHWLSGHISVELGTVRSLDKETYGWCSYIHAGPCSNEEQVWRYYYRYGAMIFLTKLLGSTDLHYENLISSGEFPFIVDTELILGHGHTILDKVSDGIDALYRESVLHSGLLPLYKFVKSGEGVDVSAISGEAGQVIPLKLPTVVNAGRADIHIEYQYPKTAGGNNRCLLFDEFQEPYQYIREIRKGFRDSYFAALKHKEELLKLVLSFTKIPVRVLLRNTQTYASVLSVSWHPRYLTKKGLREEMLDVLKDKLNPDNGFSKWRLEEEKKALLLGDIPYFYCFPEERGLRSGDGGEYPDYFQETILQSIERRIANLNVRDMELQLSLMEAAVNMGRKDKLPRTIHFSKRAEITPENSIRASEILADLIAGKMIVSETGEIGWIQFSLAGYQEKGQMIRPAGMYLYNGLAGILLFFTCLNRERQRLGYSRVQKHEEICSQLAGQLLSYTKDSAAVGQLCAKPTGLLNGEGSIALLYQLLYRNDRDPKWLDAMEQQCRILAQAIGNDREYDLLSGSAGAIMVFLNAYEFTGNHWYIDKAVQAGNHLISYAQKESNGWCWKGSSVKKGLTGMAHGNAGILMALRRLAEYNCSKDFLFAAQEALRYEDSFYDAERNDWMDLRLPPEAVWENTHTRAWCHGYGGIILSRQRIAETANELRLIEPKTTTRCSMRLKENVRHNSLCLCHGKAGDYALQLLSGRTVSALNELSELLGFVLDNDSPLEGKLSVQERWNYGLMSGLSGIGYVFLADREELEAVLTGFISGNAVEKIT